MSNGVCWAEILTNRSLGVTLRGSTETRHQGFRLIKKRKKLYKRVCMCVCVCPLCGLGVCRCVPVDVESCACAFDRCLCSHCLTLHTPKKNRRALLLLFYNYLLTISHPHLHHMSICFPLCLCIPFHGCVCVCFISLIAKDIHLAVE